MIALPVAADRIHPEPCQSGSLETQPAAPHAAADSRARSCQTPAQREPEPRGGSAMSSGRPPDGPRSAGRRAQIATRGIAGTPGGISGAYIGTPSGDLRSDPRHAGLVIDASGQRYVSIGRHYYAVRNDPANETWRAVQLQDPAKPGIPLVRDRTGNWKPHNDTGLPGGSPNDPRIEAERRSLESSRNWYLDYVQMLTTQERAALLLIDMTDGERQRAEDRLREIQDRAEDAAEQERELHQIEQRLLHAERSLRGVLDALYAIRNMVRDIEQNLALLPPRSP
ncbi:hypothetical protein [Paraburkholderia solisilvae]|uniref:Uncharacterized protein n=1 Tax=Paraburkholderia solisilvae TaxID=624376 RepID=A0A6J5CZ42_9BURK|nr:hypothetical protein [Paraburkholderia solisilvae]CAB3746427.1 hypothetical protein LMG29739_00181 [Paraburkholderia solisilvae]